MLWIGIIIFFMLLLINYNQRFDDSPPPPFCELFIYTDQLAMKADKLCLNNECPDASYTTMFLMEYESKYKELCLGS